MIPGNLVQKRIAWLIILLAAAGGGPAAAQTFLGRIGGACATLPGNFMQGIALSAPVPAGAGVLVSVATPAGFTSGMRIDDLAGNDYQLLTGARQGAGGAVVVFRAALQRGLAAGDTLLLRFDNAASGAAVCASVLAYSGIPFGHVVQEAFGTAGGQSATPTVSATAPTPATRKLVLAAFATNGAPGAVTASAPAVATAPLCIAGNSLCLVEGHYFESAATTPAVALATTSSNAWVAALSVLQADGIFGNGFD